MLHQQHWGSVVPFSKDDTHKSRSVVTCRTGMQHGRPFIAWPLHKDFWLHMAQEKGRLLHLPFAGTNGGSMGFWCSSKNQLRGECTVHETDILSQLSHWFPTCSNGLKLIGSDWLFWRWDLPVRSNGCFCQPAIAQIPARTFHASISEHKIPVGRLLNLIK